MYGVQPEGWDTEDRQMEDLCAVWCEDDSIGKMYDQEALAVGRAEVYRDAITGQVLDPRLVAEARKEELRYFAEKQVWFKRPRAEAYERHGPPPPPHHGEVGGRKQGR